MSNFMRACVYLVCAAYECGWKRELRNGRKKWKKKKKIKMPLELGQFIRRPIVIFNLQLLPLLLSSLPSLSWSVVFIILLGRPVHMEWTRYVLHVRAHYEILFNIASLTRDKWIAPEMSRVRFVAAFQKSLSSSTTRMRTQCRPNWMQIKLSSSTYVETSSDLKS